MSVQIIEQNGKPEFAVLPYNEYLRLIEQAEMAEDVQDFDRIKISIDDGDEEVIPANLVETLLQSENPVKVWREFREYSQQQLAEKAKISIPYLSQIETGKRNPSVRVLVRIASILNLDVDDLIKQ